MSITAVARSTPVTSPEVEVFEVQRGMLLAQTRQVAMAMAGIEVRGEHLTTLLQRKEEELLKLAEIAEKQGQISHWQEILSGLVIAFEGAAGIGMMASGLVVPGAMLTVSALLQVAHKVLDKFRYYEAIGKELELDPDALRSAVGFINFSLMIASLAVGGPAALEQGLIKGICSTSSTAANVGMITQGGLGIAQNKFRGDSSEIDWQIAGTNIAIRQTETRSEAHVKTATRCLKMVEEAFKASVHAWRGKYETDESVAKNIA